MLLRRLVLGVWIFFMVTGGSFVCAGESDFYFQKGVYVGGSLVHNSIGADFDGKTVYYYEAGSQYNVLPEVDSDFGFGLFIGYRLERWAMELSYQRVVHDTYSVVTGNQNGEYNVIDLNVKVDIFPQGRFRPYALIGIGAPWFDIENNRTNDGGATWTDETFKGYSVNGGLGFAYYLNSRWFLTAGAMYRWQHFRDVDGLYMSVDGMGSGMNYSLGVAYTF